MGTKRRTKEFVIHANKIKRLGVGEALLITTNPNEAQLVLVERVRRAHELRRDTE